MKKIKPVTKPVEKIGFECHPLRDLVVFDLETTGLSPDRDEIIQIAAVRMKDGKILEDDFFFSYIKPEKRIPSFITSYTGIAQRDVDQAPTPAEVLPLFAAYCGSSLLVAHNGKRFDVPFIAKTCERHALVTRETDCIDSMHLSWNLWGRVKGTSHSLDNVILRSGVSQHDIRRHDARGDVLVTARCIQTMVRQIQFQSLASTLQIHPCHLPEPSKG